MQSIGKVKAIIDRELAYVAKFNFAMIAYLFFKDVGWSNWYLLSFPIFIVWIYIDVRWIMPSEFGYLHERSPFLREMRDLIKKINDRDIKTKK